MKIAFLIAAHAYPELLVKLVRKLESPIGSVYVHIDKGVDIRPFKALFEKKGIRNTHWVRRVRSRWGTFGQVRASLSLLAEALANDKEADVFMLLSGQDYPLCPPENMAAFFDRRKGVNFIQCIRLPLAGWALAGGIERLTHYHFHFLGQHLEYPSAEVPRSRRMQLGYRACRLLLPKKRNLPDNFTFYGGANWWNLTREAAESIVEYTRNNHAFVRMFNFTLSSDEIFFQTILMNAGRWAIESNHLRSVFWDNGRNEYPGFVRMENYEEIKKSGNFFVRKVHPQYSLQVLETIDRELLTRKNHPLEQQRAHCGLERS
jgi:hypothetical protein